MDRQELAEKYISAWNDKNPRDIVRLMHPEASYCDAFWGEAASSDDLVAYFSAHFEADSRIFRIDDAPIPTQDGMIIRYTAFSSDDSGFTVPLYNGAEVITISDGLIRMVTDIYCDPNPLDLIAMATFTEERHECSRAVPLGLSARDSSRIKRKLNDLASDMRVLCDPKLSVSTLAEHVGCSVMHLFHVLEEEKKTSFVEFVADCRSRYATTLLLDSSCEDLEMRRIARDSGFTTVREFHLAFQATFGLTAEEYVRKFAQQKANG